MIGREQQVASVNFGAMGQVNNSYTSTSALLQATICQDTKTIVTIVADQDTKTPPPNIY